jgi:hypothetical protein
VTTRSRDKFRALTLSCVNTPKGLTSVLVSFTLPIGLQSKDNFAEPVALGRHLHSRFRRGHAGWCPNGAEPCFGDSVDGVDVAGIRSAVVEGSLAFHMRRATAARRNECGLQIFNLPQLAARLAGGFTTPVTAEHLEPAIHRTLREGVFTQLERVQQLPGMTRAIAPRSGMPMLICARKVMRSTRASGT